MGDRNNIVVWQPQLIEGEEEKPPLYLYSHWHGQELAKCLADAIRHHPSDRINDPTYFTRIVFCEMVKDDISGSTGFGISVQTPMDHDTYNDKLHVYWVKKYNKRNWIEFELQVRFKGEMLDANEFLSVVDHYDLDVVKFVKVRYADGES